MENITSVNPNPLVQYLNKPANQFTKADIINAVIVAPYCHNTGPPSYSIPDPSIITISIDSTRVFLNIDTSYIYLTGGSCNGRSTFKHGLDEIYPFKGIIPFNAYMPGIASGYYNFDSEMPSCICSGTLDPSYNNNVRMYDSLVAHGAVTYMNAIPGIGHVFNFPEFTEEMNQCIEFIDSVALIPTSTSQQYYSVPELLIYPNPARSELYISAERFTIEEVTIYTLTGQQTMKLRQVVDAINISHLHNGMYIVEVMIEGKKVRRKLVIE